MAHGPNCRCPNCAWGRNVALLERCWHARPEAPVITAVAPDQPLSPTVAQAAGEDPDLIPQDPPMANLLIAAAIALLWFGVFAPLSVSQSLP